MYIRKSIRPYKGKSYVNYVLVESVHTSKGPRQKTICSLGDLGARSREEWLKLAGKIEDALVGQGDLLGMDFDTLAEDPLYEVLDKLHPHRAMIEAALVERERSLFNLDATIYLSDLTSTYFEGECARNGKAKRGHSRDHRSDCKQVVVGLVVNRDGFPIAHEVFAGNTQDRTTLATMLDLLAARAGLKEGATVVVDRGMAFDENIAEIKQRKLHYVVASRQPERDRWLGDFEDTEGFTAVLRQPSPLNPGQKKTMIEVKTRRDGDQTYVLCRSEQRIPKDRAIRTKQEGTARRSGHRRVGSTSIMVFF